MKLWELIDVIDHERESKIEYLEICRPNGNWEDCDLCLTSSALLIPLYHQTVKAIGAVEENIIRVDIDWTGVLYDWTKVRQANGADMRGDQDDNQQTR